MFLQRVCKRVTAPTKIHKSQSRYLEKLNEGVNRSDSSQNGRQLAAFDVVKPLVQRVVEGFIEAQESASTAQAL